MAKSDLQHYCELIVNGGIVSCRYVRKECERLLADIENGCGRWHFDIGRANHAVEFIERFCKIPSGKIGQPFILELYEKAWLQAMFGFVDEDGKRRFNEVLIMVGRKNGKALSLDTLIPTPDGWKKLQDVHEGDYVFAQDGTPSRVLVESEIFEKPMYEVEFEDGAVIKASADHVWTVRSKRSRKLDKYKAKSNKRRYAAELIREGGWYDATTEELYENYKRVRLDGKGTEYLYRVPMCHAVQYQERDLPIDPYLLGAWLGDGTSSKPQITICEAEIEELVPLLEEGGFKLSRTTFQSGKDKAPLFDIDHHGRSGKLIPGSFSALIREVGVYKNKHIPEEYMQSSVRQRFELLKGLMDTDGFCSKAGQCEFVQKNKNLAFQVKELLASLGIKSTIKEKNCTYNGKQAGTAWRVTFFTDKANSCFKLKRKHDRLKESLSDRMTAKSIVRIESIPVEKSKCIAIDHPSHLYLAGRDYTATHNTSLAAAIELYMLIADGEGAPQIYNVATSGDQASLGFNAVNKMVLQSGKLSKHIKKVEGGLSSRALNMGIIKPLNARPSTLDGLDVHLCVMDELAAMKDRDLYDLLKQGMSAREQPMMLEITTNGFVRDQIFDAQVEYARKVIDGEVDDQRLLPFLYELDDRDEWDKESCWIKANPGLGPVKKIEALREFVQKAKDDPSFKATVMTKDFNMPENTSCAWLNFEEAVNEEPFELKKGMFRYGIFGFDASDSVDLTAAKLLMMRPGDDHIYVHSMYWIPEDVILNDLNSGKRTERDGVPYQQWIARGMLRTVPGNKIDKRVLLDWMQEVKEVYDVYPYAVGFD